MEDSEELLEPGCSFTWQWVGAAGVIASIQVRSEGDAVRLAYQRGGASESWKSEVWVLLLSFRTASSPPPKLCLVTSGGRSGLSTSFINIFRISDMRAKSITEAP